MGQIVRKAPDMGIYNLDLADNWHIVGRKYTGFSVDSKTDLFAVDSSIGAEKNLLQLFIHPASSSLRPSLELRDEQP